METYNPIHDTFQWNPQMGIPPIRFLPPSTPRRRRKCQSGCLPNHISWDGGITMRSADVKPYPTFGVYIERGIKRLDYT